MIKNKSPLVKVLRKAGFSSKESMHISHKAWNNFLEERDVWQIIKELRRNFNELSLERDVASMFVWKDSPELHHFWLSVQLKINSTR